MRGKAYRRDMEAKNDRRLRKIITECRCTPSVGYIERELCCNMLAIISGTQRIRIYKSI